MSVSDTEFLGDGVLADIITELRDLRQRVDRAERWSEPSLLPPMGGVSDVIDGEQTERTGVPPLRHFNARWHNSAELSEQARPNNVLPLDAQGNVDYRSTGGLVAANKIIVGVSDDTVILDGRDTTYRMWIGASATGSAPRRWQQTGTEEVLCGSDSNSRVRYFSEDGSASTGTLYVDRTDNSGSPDVTGFFYVNEASTTNEESLFNYWGVQRRDGAGRVLVQAQMTRGTGSPIFEIDVNTDFGGNEGRTTYYKTITKMWQPIWFDDKTASPTSASKGTLAYADGSTWSPCAGGEGFYGYDGVDWIQLSNVRVEKYMDFGAAQLAKGAAAPDAGSVGSFGNLLFANTGTEEVFFNVHLPADWTTGTDVKLAVYWSPTTTDQSGSVCWEFDWTAVNDGEVTTGCTHVDIHDSPNGTAYEMQETDYGVIGGAGLAMDDTIGIKLYRDHDDAVDAYNADAALYHIEVEYKADRRGPAD